MWNTFFDEVGRITTATAMQKYAQAYFEKQAWQVPNWASGVARHAAMGAVPGAAAGAVTAKPGERKKGALKGAATGAAIGAVGGNLALRAKRDSNAYAQAVKDHGPERSQKLWDAIKDIKSKTPLYGATKTSAKKVDDWEHPDDSVMSRHGGKILGSVAGATAGGLAAHKLYRRHRQKTDASSAARKQYESQSAWQKGHGTSAKYPHRRPLTEKQLGPGRKPAVKPQAAPSDEARFGKFPEGTRVAPGKKLKDVIIRKPNQGSMQNLLDAVDEQLTGQEYIHHDPTKGSQRVKLKLRRVLPAETKPKQLNLRGFTKLLKGKHASVDDVVQSYLSMN